MESFRSAVSSQGAVGRKHHSHTFTHRHLDEKNPQLILGMDAAGSLLFTVPDTHLVDIKAHLTFGIRRYDTDSRGYSASFSSETKSKSMLVPQLLSLKAANEMTSEN